MGVALPPVVVTASRSLIDTLAAHLPRVGTVASVVLLGTWVLLTTALFFRLLLGMRFIHRQRRMWKAREVDGVPVLLAPDIGPAVVGIRRPAVVFPVWALSFDSGLRRLVLQHEMEHVRARDTIPCLLASLATALTPWNPAIWWQAHRLRLATEVDCDARVLRADVRPDRYGLLLLAIAQRQTSVAFAPALSEPTSQLEQRIAIMQRSAPRHPVLLFTGLTLVAGFALMLACSAPAPDAALSTAPDGGVGSASASATTPAGVVGGNTPQAGSSRTSTPQQQRPYVEFTLSKRATMAAGNTGPRYPDALRAAKIEGEVLTQFVVDEGGRVDTSSIKVLKSTHPAFTAAVRAALASFRYSPAEVSGRKVRQLVQEPFSFTLRR
jgi:TonB family protein